MRAKAAIATLVLAGCSSSALLGEHVRIEPGPSFGREVRSVATLGPTCASMESMAYEGPAQAECDDGMIATIDRVTTGFLSSSGVRIERTQTLNAAIFDKFKALQGEEPGEDRHDDVAPRVLFRSASPALQSQVLEELGVDAVLRTRILIGAAVGMSQRRRILALITLFDGEGELIWASRCEREAGPLLGSADVMQVTMCALEEAASL